MMVKAECINCRRYAFIFQGSNEIISSLHMQAKKKISAFAVVIFFEKLDAGNFAECFFIHRGKSLSLGNSFFEIFKIG